MQGRTLTAGILAVALGATSAAAQPNRLAQQPHAPDSAPPAFPQAGPPARPGAKFCAAVRRTVQLMKENGPRGFTILQEYADWGEDHPNVGRRPLIPGFREMSFYNSTMFLRANLHGGFSAFNGTTAEQIAREIAEAISGCYPGTMVTEQRHSDSMSFGVSPGRDQPSFGVLTNRYNQVSLDISLWKPGQREQFERERAQFRDAYTREGCAVGDDLCKSRKLMGR